MSTEPNTDPPCAAGRNLVEPPDGNPFWALPCPNPGTDILILDEVGEQKESVVLHLCLAHIVALNPDRIA